MRYFHLREAGERRLAVETADGTYDLTAGAPRLRTFRDLVRTADLAGLAPDELADRHLDDAGTVSRDGLEARWTDPVAADEVWAAGVTYEISEAAREEESDTPEMYLNVYDAERPEIFFKATPSRTVGPAEPVGIRGDSEWDVPEPELGIVIYEGDVVGYTIGNDMSSRSIEGANPLYLPQAKTYARCCAIGPCVTTDIEDPHSLAMSMTIHRDGREVYHDETSTGEMVRTCEELVSYYTAHNEIPELSVLLTGTSLVPDEGFTLREGDRIEISIESIGTLANSVTVV